MDKIDTLFNEIGDGRVVKMEIDCSDKVDKCIPQAEKLAKVLLSFLFMYLRRCSVVLSRRMNWRKH